MITEADDYFTHQIIQPHEQVLYNDPTWAERAFFTVGHPEEFLLEFGMAYFPNRYKLEAYAVCTLSDQDVQYNLRAARSLEESRWDKSVGPFHYETLRPLDSWSLTVEENKSPIQFDLTFEARTVPLECRSPRIEKKGRLVYDNVDFFQSGRYSGEVRIGDRRISVDQMPGHRDRTWGIRTSGEGKFRRGVLIWFEGEFEDYSAMALIHERHNGEHVVAAGGISYEDGEQIPFIGYQHDLQFIPDTKLFRAGRFHFLDEKGRSWNFQAERLFPLFMAGAGYRSSEGKRGELEEGTVKYEVWDQTDVSSIPEGEDGLIDNMCRIRSLDEDEETHGVVELILGEHHRYPAYGTP